MSYMNFKIIQYPSHKSKRVAIARAGHRTGSIGSGSNMLDPRITELLNISSVFIHCLARFRRTAGLSVGFDFERVSCLYI